MATYQYTGKTTAGRRVKGLVAAESLRAARDKIRDLGVDIASVDQRTDQRDFRFLQAMQRRRLSGALTEFSREMSTLLTAGVPLLDAIDCCIPQAKPSLQAPLAALRDDVAGGKSLAEAMEREAWLFDDMLRGMVRVGENSGNLDEVLDQVATFREQSEQLKNRVLSAVTYPAIVFGVSILVTLFLMTVVVPMLLDNLAELGGQLPWPTRVLKFLSDALLAQGWWLALIAAAVLAAFAAWARTAAGRMKVSQLALRTPLLGGLIRKQAIGRMSLVIACLLRSGVELVSALRIAGDSADNVVLRESISELTTDIERGEDMREAILKHAVFPPSVAQIYALGQQSGQLESMLQKLGTDYDRQANVLANRVASVAEPILILFLSVVVGFILFATILPILEAGNVIAG